MIQVLEVEMDYEIELIQETITNLTKKEILRKTKDNLLKIKKNYFELFLLKQHILLSSFKKK